MADAADVLNGTGYNDSSSSSTWNDSLDLLFMMNDHDSTSKYVERMLVSHVMGKICILGMVGNILNLIVLTRRSLTTNMERMER